MKIIPESAAEAKLLADIMQAGLDTLCEDLGWPGKQDSAALAEIVAEAKDFGVSIPDEIEVAPSEEEED